MNAPSLASRRAAERFAELIELDATPALAGSDGAMHPAVSLAAALRAAGRTASPAPRSADARLAMRERLVAAANAPAEASLLTPGVAARVGETAQQRAKAVGHGVRRRVTALVGSVVVMTSFAGVGVAAARSLPGDPFYGVKRATENVQLWLASGQAAKGERHLEFARTRLAEARSLGGDSRYASSTLSAMNQETREGSSDLLAAYRSSGDTEPLADLVTFTREQYASLERYGETVPTTLQAQTFYSMTLLVGLAQDVRSLSGNPCLSCLVNGTVPGSTPTPGSNGSPSTSPSASTSPSSTGSTHPQPSSILPTGIIPTKIPTQLPTKLPTKLPSLPPLGHNGHKGQPAPTLTPLPLLSSLTQLLGHKN
ncbi:MAG: DUF5667 domain-containing protein [Mycobacteriales bacterium]